MNPFLDSMGKRGMNPFLDSMGKRAMNPFLDSMGKRSDHTFEELPTEKRCVIIFSCQDIMQIEPDIRQ